MYYGRKKGIIIASIVVVLVIVLGVAGLLIYLNTDLFKSNETLFFKYMGQTLENLEYTENAQLAEIENLKNQMPYIVEGNLSFGLGEENNSIPNIQLNLESKADRINEKSYTKADLQYNSQNLFSLEYANSNNIYALKSDEIVTSYLGIENDNLKVLAQKLGITGDVPDTITTETNLKEIFEISEEEKAHIQETYFDVLKNNISKDNFTKDKDLAISKQGVTYNTTAYRLSLSAEELKQLEIAILTTLKEDSITLNLIATKAKLLGLEEYTEINNLTSEIQDEIDTITNTNTNTEAGIDIIVYVEGGKVVTTDIIIENETKFSFYGETNGNTSNKSLSMEDLSGNSDINVITLQLNETRNDTESTQNIELSLDDTIKLNVYITNKGSASQNSLNTIYEITVEQEGEIISTINYNQEMTFQNEINIIELDRTNCGVLNDYTTEQLQVLMQAVTQRTTEVIGQKMEVLGLDDIINSMMMYQSQLEMLEEVNEEQQNLIEEIEKENQRLNEMLSGMNSEL